VAPEPGEPFGVVLAVVLSHLRDQVEIFRLGVRARLVPRDLRERQCELSVDLVCYDRELDVLRVRLA
jgi:hypothetical protein